MSQSGILNIQNQAGVVDSVTGANGVTASPTSGSVVVSGVNATTSSVGVASFNPAEFTVSSGAVSSIDGIMLVSGQLTSAQIKTLHGTPQTIIAAPGAGKVIQILHSVATLNYGGSNAFTNGQAIQLSYSTTTSIMQLITTSQIIATANELTIANPNALNSTYAIANNLAVTIYNTGTEITGNAAGDNTVSYNILYRIVTIP